MKVELVGITKSFGEVIANDAVSLTVAAGTIHALLGENGAGKSTLMNVLYGLVQPDSGEIRIDGRPVRISGPLDAITMGIGMVHQDFLQIHRMSVVENVVLGLRHGIGVARGGRLDLAAARARISELSATYGLGVDPDQMIDDLSVGEQQRVEIIKLLYRDARMLILDEPTGVLTQTEAESLYSVLDNLRSAGRSVLLITHKMAEVFSHSEDITVMRGGRVVLHERTADVTAARLSTAMVGVEVPDTVSGGQSVVGEPMFHVERLSVRNSRGVLKVDDVSMTVRSGEILGVAGVDGNGQGELAAAITGTLRPEQGRLWLDGTDVSARDTSARRAMGVCHVPADRRGVGTIGDWSLVNNVGLGRLSRHVRRRYLVSRESMARDLEDIVRRFSVRTGGGRSTASTLSGGNLQKLILGRELYDDPMLVIAEQPTRGLDVASTAFVRGLLRETATKGRGVLLISADLDEILQVCDRFVVMHEGRITGEFVPGRVRAEEIGLAMSGGGR